MDDEFASAALAIAAADLDLLGELLAANPDLATYRAPCGHPTLLQLVACEHHNLPDPVGAARVLVDAGAETTWPLISAAGCGARGVLEYLLDRGVAVDGTEAWTPLDEALYWDNTEIAVELIARGATIRTLRTAAGLGNVDTMLRFFAGDTVTDDAGPIRSPFPDTVPDALANDPQSIIDNAFVMAVNNGHRDAAGFLLDRGADVNATPPGFHWHGAALHAACWRGNRKLVEWLLEVGADPSIRDGMVDSDAAGWADHHGHVELAAMLGRRPS